MKKIFSVFLIALFLGNSLAFGAWSESDPAGTRSASDIDTYVVANNTALQDTLSGIKGWTNLKVATSGSATTITVTADMLLLQASSSIAYRKTSVNSSIAITTSGAGGLVASLSEASSSWYYVWIARKSSDGTVNGYLSTTTSLSTFLGQVDSGYDQAALVSAVFNDGSSNFIDFVQTGKFYVYKSGRTLASGSTGDTTSWTSLDTASFIPSALSDRAFGTYMNSTSTYFTNNSSTSADTTVVPNKLGTNDGSTQFIDWEFSLLTADTLYWCSTSASSKIYVDGFILNKI